MRSFKMCFSYQEKFQHMEWKRPAYYIIFETSFSVVLNPEKGKYS